MAVSVSSSSPSAAALPTFAVWLHDMSGNRLFLVDVPVLTGAVPGTVQPADSVGSLPPVILYLGNYYFWSANYFKYVQTVPYSVTGDLGAQQLSVLCNPQL